MTAKVGDPNHIQSQRFHPNQAINEDTAEAEEERGDNSPVSQISRSRIKISQDFILDHKNMMSMSSLGKEIS